MQQALTAVRSRIEGWRDTPLADKLLSAGAALLASLSIFHVASKSILSGEQAFEFKYFWLAGKIWNDGGNPYDENYQEIGRVVFQSAQAPLHWVYPPNWAPISTALAQFDYKTAEWLWQLMNLVWIVAGVCVAWRLCVIMRDGSAFLPTAYRIWRPAALLLAYVCFFAATALTLHNGQTSALMFFGLTLCSYGFVREKPLLIAISIVILMLKPQIGVPISAFIFLSKNGVKPVLIAAAIVIASGAQAFFIAGFPETITMFLERMAAYESNDPMANSSIRMTGLRNLIYLATSAETPMMAYVAGAALLASGAAIFLRVKKGFSGGGASRDRLVAFCGLTTLLVFLLPLHSNDLMMLVAAAPLLFLASWGPGLLIAAGLMLMFRSNNLAPLLERIDLSATSGYFAAMAFVDTVALTLCIAGLAAVFWPKAKAAPRSVVA